MRRLERPEDLDSFARLGWIREPSPLLSLPTLAREHGLASLVVKRDDLVPELHGGTKVRKLDYLLAQDHYRRSPWWAAAGGIGSGMLVALTAAAERIGHRLHAHAFWTPRCSDVLDNLAFTVSGPTRLSFYPSRTALALRHPGLLDGGRLASVSVVPPGATSAVALVGMVRAGLELATQLRDTGQEVPERVYVALGSGGCAAGLSVGLALGGLRTRLVAVSVVEHLLSTRARLMQLQRALCVLLEAHGYRPPAAPVPVIIDRFHVGPAYGAATPEAEAARELLAAEGVRLDGIYTAKAMAALLDDAKREGGPVLFWNTLHGGSLPRRDDWMDLLPDELSRRLRDPEHVIRVPRRRALVATAAVLTAAALGIRARTSGYLAPTWQGAVLADWESIVVRAAVEAIMPPAPNDGAFEAVAARVDAYLVALPASLRRQVHALLVLVEQGTWLSGELRRFTRLSPTERAAVLDRLATRGGSLAAAAGALRDLCLYGYYQQPATWSSIGYDGPLVPLGYDPRGPGRMAWPSYDSLVAAPGALPQRSRP